MVIVNPSTASRSRTSWRESDRGKLPKHLLERHLLEKERDRPRRELRLQPSFLPEKERFHPRTGRLTGAHLRGGGSRQRLLGLRGRGHLGGGAAGDEKPAGQAEIGRSRNAAAGNSSPTGRGPLNKLPFPRAAFFTRTRGEAEMECGLEISHRSVVGPIASSRLGSGRN